MLKLNPDAPAPLLGCAWVIAEREGLWTLCAGITQPNDASNGLHCSMGFVPVGTYRRIGWKAGAWHDVQWWQLDLHPGEPGPPGELVAQTEPGPFLADSFPACC